MQPLGTTVTNLIKAEMVGLLTAEQIHDIACVAQENINTTNSVISNDDITTELLERMKYVF